MVVMVDIYYFYIYCYALFNVLLCLFLSEVFMVWIVAYIGKC